MPENILRTRRAAWATLLLLGVLQGWMFRHAMSPDGVAYLDLSDAVINGRPLDLINGYWSPLYPALLGVLRLLVSGTPVGAPYWEFALVHVVSFVGFALSLAAYEWLLRELDDAGADWDNDRPFLTVWGRVTAYVLFGVTSLGMISVAGTVPDFFLSAGMFGAFACVLRLRRAPDDARAARRLGLTLGLAALTKSFAFPLSAVVLATTAIANARRGGLAAATRAAVVFVAVTAPWVIALSLQLGHFSMGRTGALNYAWYVNEQQPPNTGIMPALSVDEAQPLKRMAVLDGARGTNPLWYDPARWHADVRVRFSAAQQWSRLSRSLRYYVYVAAPLLLVAFSIAVAGTRRDLAVALDRSYTVLVPCLAALGAYALVYTLSRLIAPFVAAMFLVLAAAFPRDAVLRGLAFSAAFGLSLFGIHAVAPPGVRSMIVVTYGLALFATAWLLMREGRPAVRWAVSLLAIAAVWLLPVRSTAEAATMSLGVSAVMFVAVRRMSPDSGHARAVRKLVAVGAVVALAVPTLAFGVAALTGGATGAARSTAHPEWSTAQRVISQGVPRGSRIVLLGTPANWGWARLAGYQIVGIIPDEDVDAFVALNGSDRVALLRALFAGGAAPHVLRASP